MAHGLVRFALGAENGVWLVCRHAEKPVIRLILERGGERDKERFRMLCASLEKRYPDVKFIGGNYKPTWERLYAFAGDDMGDGIDQQVGSMKSVYGKALPWLWHKLHGEKALARARKEGSGAYLFDYL